MLSAHASMPAELGDMLSTSGYSTGNAGKQVFVGTVYSLLMKLTTPSNKAIKKLFFLLLCLSAFAYPAGAIYKIHSSQANTSGKIIAGSSAGHIAAWQHVPPHTPQDDGPKHSKRAGIWRNKDGIISFATGISAAALAVLSLLFIVDLSPVIAILGIASAIIAILSGAKGRRKRPRGFAVAGLSLGIAVLAGAATLGLGILLILLIL